MTQLELFETTNNTEQLFINPLSPVVVSYGGGVNSTALLIALKYKNIIPDDIIFADTQAEMPETYQYLEIFNQWLINNGMPSITVVKQNSFTHRKTGQQYSSIEEKCLLSHELPSKAYGHSSCALQYKILPMDKYVKNKYQNLLKEGVKIRRLIGYHAGEIRRMLKHNISEDKIFIYEYPLIDYGLSQGHCNVLIANEGLKIPPKSSCFFCPNRKPLEVLELREKYPDLYKRGCDIENNANLRSIVGLGRNFRWKDIGELTPIELKIMSIENRQCQCIN
jgi:hypothetical protein